MSKKTVTLEEGKLKGIKLHSLWLRERLIGKDFVDQNNLQRLYEPSLIDQTLSIKDYIVEDNFLNITFTDGVNGKINIDDLITHEFSLEDINQSFDFMHEGKSIRSVINF